MKAIPRSLSPIADFLVRHSAIIALALFAAVGVAVLDDYGIPYDELEQRNIGYDSFNYILGNAGALRGDDDHARFYGVGYELPRIAFERILGLEDSRGIYLFRRLVTHALFLAGGFFAWLLARRLFGSRLAALFAMLIFLLHPRLYAQSFFNSKDLPFLSAFMIALYLIHRAFRRDSAWAFALCGAAVGLLANIRIMGLMLIPAVLGMLALDMFYGAKQRAPKPTNPLPIYGGGLGRGAANAGAFLTAFAAAFYAAFPILWRDPLDLANTLGTLSVHPARIGGLFRGENVYWPNIPWDFIPTWILITTPPVALILSALGIGYVARLCAARPRAALANSAARFGLLALACLVSPVAAAIALNSNMFNDWRHMYFLYAPICVLAAFGLRALADIPKPRLRAGAFALAALGMAVAAIQMVQIHPHQNLYFNALVGKSDLANRWEMDYFRVSEREALNTILQIQPAGNVAMADYGVGNAALIPEDDRRRLRISRAFPSFLVSYQDEGDAAVWTREVYGVPIVSVVDLRAESQAALGAIYSAARASEPDASAGGFYMYARGGELVYIKDGCGEADRRGWFALSAFPVDRSDLPEQTRDAGLERQSIYFRFYERGGLLGGNCVVVQDLPDFPISHIETWRDIPGEGAQWSALIKLDGYYERHRRALASLSGETPAMRSGFDVYLKDNALTYVKAQCDEYEARGRFFLSVFPADPRDLPQSARDAGLEHEPRNFDFARDGAIFDGKCAIIRDLPNYTISRIETGQWIPGEGELWRGEIAVGD